MSVSMGGSSTPLLVKVLPYYTVVVLFLLVPSIVFFFVLSLSLSSVGVPLVVITFPCMYEYRTFLV